MDFPATWASDERDLRRCGVLSRVHTYGCEPSASLHRLHLAPVRGETVAGRPAPDGVRVHPGAGGAAARGARFLEANADAPLSALRELGWLGVSVPEERGGGGLSFVDEAILFEEAGRALYSGPFLTTAVVLPALPELDEQAWSVELDGLVPHLDTADRVLRADMTTVPAEGETLPTVDETRPLGRLADAEGEALDGDFEPVRLRLLAGLAVEAVGVAGKALELGVEYVSTRASSSARRSAPTRPSPTRSPTRTSRRSWPARSPTGPPGAWPRRTSRHRPRSRRRRPSAPRPPSPPASARSRCTAGSASLGARPAPLLQARPVDRRVRRQRGEQREVVAAALLDYKGDRCPSRRMKCSS